MNIYETIYREGILKNLIQNIGKLEDDENLNDLEQDIYLHLMEKGKEQQLQKMYDNGQIVYYLARIVSNQIHSHNSPYYYKYKKNNNDDNISVDEIIKLEDERNNKL